MISPTSVTYLTYLDYRKTIITSVKRILIYGLVLGLVAAPVGVSICVPSTGCTSMEAHSHNVKMATGGRPMPTVTSQSNSCCAISQARMPESKTEVSKTGVKLELATTPTSTSDLPDSKRADPRSVPRQEPSFPSLRSLLCPYLI